MDTRAEVIRAAEARARALENADAVTLEDLLHEDFRWTSHTGELFRRDDYIERNTQGQVPWRSQQLGQVDVAVVGETAVLLADVTDEIAVGGALETFHMPMTQVWVRRDGRWRCLAGHAGPRRT